MIVKLTIDPEFQKLIPPLSSDEFALLEQNIIKEGCRDKLVTWENKIIDGHNRYKICHKNKVRFETTEMHFNEKSEAIEWIIKNQFGRRNMPLYERSVLALRLEDEIKERAKERMLSGKKADPAQKSAEGETRKEVAKIAGVSHDTISKVKVIEEKATQEQKEALRTGEKKINRVYREITTTKKICKTCGKELPIEDFYEKKSSCKHCHNQNRNDRYTDIKGDVLGVSPELIGITEAEIVGDLYNVDKVIEYTIDDLNESIGSVIDTFCRQARADLTEHKNLLTTEKNAKKITANLLRVVEAVKIMIGDIAK